MIPGAAAWLGTIRTNDPGRDCGGARRQDRGLRPPGRAAGAELPQSTLRKVPDAGHMIDHIVPEQVAAVILDVARAAFGHDRRSNG